MRALDDLLPDAPAPASGWFDLSGDVGRGFATAREDAIRLEAILANAGDHDLSATDGPTGYWGTALDTALRRYQKRNDLAVDGWARPDGPTIRHMRDTLGGLLGNHETPTPDQIDAHHASLDAGGDPQIAMAPQTKLGTLPGLPDIGKTGRGSNASQIDWLARNRIGYDGVPEQLARYASELGEGGIAQARDFVAQFAARNPRDADALTAGILTRLPDDAARTNFLGRTPGFGLPAGVRLPGGPIQPQLRTMEMRREDSGDPRATNRNLLAHVDDPVETMLAAERDEEASTQTAEAKDEPNPAKPAPLGPDKAAIKSGIEEYEAYAKSKGHVGESKECVALVKYALPELGATPNWRAGTAVKGLNDPQLQPGTAVATFDPGDEGDMNRRYPNKPTGNHAGLFMGYGEHNGRQGMWLLDQSRGRPAQQSFFPFERRPNEGGNSAGEFSVILPKPRKATK